MRHFRIIFNLSNNTFNPELIQILKRIALVSCTVEYRVQTLILQVTYDFGQYFNILGKYKLPLYVFSNCDIFFDQQWIFVLHS